MRILIITDSYQRQSHIGGGDLIGQKLERGLTSRGHTISIVTSRGPSYADESVPGVHRIFLRAEELRMLTRSEMLAEIEEEKRKLDGRVEAFQPDVLLGLQQAELAVPVIAHINALHIPKVYRIGGDWLYPSYWGRMSCPYAAWRYPLRRIVMGVARLMPFPVPAYRLFPRPPFQPERVIFNSRDLLERHRSITDGAGPCVVVRNGIDLDHFSFRKRAPGQPLRILYVGRLIPRKGAHLLVEALAAIRAMNGFSDTTLTIIGAPHKHRYLRKLKRRTALHGLEGAITYRSMVSQAELPAVYHEHDILAFPLRARRPQERGEGCPSVLLEAMACGLPLVSSIVPGTNEILEDGKNCLAIDNDDPLALARRITELARDSEMYRKLQAQGRAYVEQHHTLDGMITAVEEQLQKAAALPSATTVA